MKQNLVDKQCDRQEACCQKIRKIKLGYWLIVFMIVSMLGIAMVLSTDYFVKTFNMFFGSIKTETIKISQNTEMFNVIVKESLVNKTKSDIYFKNKETGEENIFVTLTDVYCGHYHNAEYHNGNLYIIRRTGGDDGYQTNPNWTDELWRYDQWKQGKMLYSVSGLDFRVSDDEKFIAIIGNKSKNVIEDEIVLIKIDGTILKIFDRNEIGLENYNPISWTKNSFWMSDFFGPSIQNIVKIEIANFQVTRFNVSDLPIIIREFDLNPIKEKIVFSDHPAIFDVDSAQDFRATNKVVTLFVYDLKSKNKLIIATSTAKEFKPKWIDENILEYDDQFGDNRIRHVFQNQK